MKFLRRVMPHLCISFALAIMVLAYVDNRNPMMCFLSSDSGWTLLYTGGAVFIFNAILQLCRPRRRERAPSCVADDDFDF